MHTTMNNYKDDFILDEGVNYLNCANMSPMLKKVKEAGLQALDMRAAPWNITSEDWFIHAEKLRGLAASIFQTNANNIALISSASYGLAAAAKNLQMERGRNIIVLEDQFPSNYYVWENLAKNCGLQIVVVPKAGNKTLTDNILDRIDKDTGLVTIPNCHWMDGTLIDLKAIKEAARSVGAYLVLDLSQSFGALPINIEEIDPDFAVSVGYKWQLGPYGLGYMYVSKKWQEIGEPLEYSWITRKGSEDFAGLTSYANEYRDGARKFDMGETAQFNILPMAIAALKQILQWKVDFIQTEIKKMTDRILEYKKSIGMFAQNSISAGHMTSIPLGNTNAVELREKLKNERIIISFRGTFIRVSPHLYNDMDDVERLISCLPVAGFPSTT